MYLIKSVFFTLNILSTCAVENRQYRFSKTTFVSNNYNCKQIFAWHWTNHWKV